MIPDKQQNFCEIDKSSVDDPSTIPPMSPSLERPEDGPRANGYRVSGVGNGTDFRNGKRDKERIH